MKQALGKIRAAPGRAWRGTARTAKWAGSGIASGPRRAGRAVAGATRDARERVRDTAEGAWDRTGGARVAAKASSRRRTTIAWVAVAILVVAWIGWAIYTTTEWGGAAGLGVLISWPVAIAALALVAAPFVGLYLLVQRVREPALAGPAGGLADRPQEAKRDDGGNDDGDDAPKAADEGDEPGGDPGEASNEDDGDESDDEGDDGESEEAPDEDDEDSDEDGEGDEPASA